MELRTVQNGFEQSKAIELSKSIFKPNMAEQFTLLFSQANWNHMFIAVDDGNIVALVNYYPSVIRIGAVQIKAASIGSVCTNIEYRGRKLASRLLSLAEAQMSRENIQLMIISGAGGIYADIGASLAGNDYEYLIDCEELDDDPAYEIKNFLPIDFHRIKKIHDQEPIRYERTEKEFKTLLSSQTYPDTFATYPVHLIEKDHQCVGYVVGFMPTEGDEFGIKEFAGDRRAVKSAFKLLLKTYQRDKIHFAADVKDEIVELFANATKKLIHQHASFKITDFVGLMTSLIPYFKTYYDNIDIGFDLIDHVPTFLCGSEIYQVSDLQMLSRLIFGSGETINLAIDNAPQIQRFITQVFPLPFVWTNNLNYQ